MALSWASLIGEFEFSSSSITFIGSTVEFERDNAKQAISTIGIAMCNQRFQGGLLAASIEFKELTEDSTCELILYHDPISQFHVTAGLGGAGPCMYSIRHYDGKNWHFHQQVGDRKNIRAKQTYRLGVEVLGSRVRLAVDGVNVAATDLPFTIPESQTGVWCRNRGKINVSKFHATESRPKAFVVMQFSSPFNELYSDVIKAVCKEFEIDVVRADEQFGPGIIISEVATQIIESKLVIAEISSGNPNVYYEVGFAHALNKPTILIAERPTKLPFDVAPHRVLFYENSINGKAKLEDGLRRHIEAILATVQGG